MSVIICFVFVSFVGKWALKCVQIIKSSRLTVLFSLFPTAGLQATTKHSGFPVRMDNTVPIVPQAPAAQPLQIQSGVLTQVNVRRALRMSVNYPEYNYWFVLD